MIKTYSQFSIQKGSLIINNKQVSPEKAPWLVEFIYNAVQYLFQYAMEEYPPLRSIYTSPDAGLIYIDTHSSNPKEYCTYGFSPKHLAEFLLHVLHYCPIPLDKYHKWHEEFISPLALSRG